MPEPRSIPPFPQAATVENVRDYLDWHVQNGRGKYVLEMRAQYVVIPPSGDTHIDSEQTAILRGYY